MPNEARYPLQSWTLCGFRAIRDKTVFPLGGLNVLVGANSAGKSSVLHSMLLTAQTLGNPLADRPLVLNGSLVRLGLANDCVHEDRERSMMLGFTLSAADDSPAYRGLELGSVDVHAEFSMASDGADFLLEETTVTGISAEGDVPDQRLVMSARTERASKDALQRAGLEPSNPAMSVAENILGVKGDTPDRTAGAVPRQFLPDRIAVVANAVENELHQFFRFFRYQPQGARRRTAPLSPPAAAVFRRLLADNLDDEIADLLPVDQEISVASLSELPPDAVNRLRRLSMEWQQLKIGEIPFRGELEFHGAGELVAPGLDEVRKWFASNVRHLGPLRASPQPLYNLPEAASGDSVGRQGEYTAAVLSTYGKRYGEHPMPDGSLRRTHLGTAVDAWMKALGLLAAVRSQESGKLGFELHVSVEGVDRELDLTTVGVGVSQALPIVVLGLIADRRSLLLFEQPELHLHPNVQAALGDFFLALARSGRQLVVETHSEYFINRLRRRQRTEPDADVAELVRLFFFERSGSTSTVRPGRISPDGGMPNWPKGFLDTAAREVQAMLASD